MRLFFTLLCIGGIAVHAYAYTVPTYTPQQPQAGGMCGSFGWNLGSCDCVGATAACSTDPSLGCSPQPGVYPVAYIATGRCHKDRKGDCPQGAVVSGRPNDQWSSTTQWLNLSNPEAIARYERLVAEAAKKGYKAVEPDDTAEYTTVAQLQVITDIAQKYGMKVVIKNDIQGTWAQLLVRQPQYKANVALVLAESCVQHGECAKYTTFRDMGIPIVLAEYKSAPQAITAAAKLLHAAAMFVPVEHNVRARSTVGSICVSGSSLTPGRGPSQEQLAALAQQAQTLAGRSTSYNPGGGSWGQQDFNRLQPTATPSYLNPNQSLGSGASNPYAQQYWRAPGVSSNVAPTQFGAPSTTIRSDTGSSVGTVTPVASTYTQESSDEGDEPPVTSVRTASDVQATSSVRARVSCVPQVLPRGGNVSVSWRCAPGCTSLGTATNGSFTTNTVRVGSKKVQVTQSTGFTIRCVCADGASAPASCSVRVTAPQVRTTPYTSPTQSVAEPTQNTPQACFLGFCL